MTKEFKITSLSRSDLHSIGFDTNTLTDNDMQQIADRMGESYCEGNACFWNDLESIAIDIYQLKQHNM